MNFKPGILQDPLRIIQLHEDKELEKLRRLKTLEEGLPHQLLL